MGVSLQELLDWPTEIGNLASATHAVAATHNRSAEFYRSLASASTWEGAAGATAQQAMVASAGDHEDAADRIGKAARAMDHAEQESESLATDVKTILNDAAAAPAVEVNTATNEVIPPDTSYLTEEAAAAVAAKVASLQTRITVVLARGVAVDAELAQAISSASGVPAAKAPQPTAAQSPPAQPAPPQPNSLDEALGQLAGGDGPLRPPKPRPPMDPAEAERAKAALRQVMANDGVPPDQIEARVNELRESMS
ncbi:hypothetical protein [Mycolicibacterium fluoranthenivorans]|uniref:PPE domain-containing protein n=1 Tax=Mycolicibacterium fluoranthenivorans TaxID=258505 RepID=A0A7X5TVM7_9MYCO|nr:hypothetical protein [Mycolicibacterium fluoranthenivorans]MCV7359327.1 hypothetical protein [Mycolicibacterium fluoranthenivorans]NIH93586.1 hypothetical protein [Mycolicibacterium fluoranthenivorans]